jgi:hypothetical protein
MNGWMMAGKEARELDNMINTIMLFLACVGFIGMGLMLFVAFRPEIREALRFAQGLIFG